MVIALLLLVPAINTTLDTIRIWRMDPIDFEAWATFFAHATAAVMIWLAILLAFIYA